MSPRRAVASLACALVVAGCGGGEDEEKKASTQAAAGTFSDPDVGFTFRYPPAFEQVDRPEGDLASVTPAPGDKQNAIKIRQIAAQELPFASYADQIRQQFAEELKTEVSQREENRADLQLGVLEWQTAGLHSINYMFAGAGKTWQLECLSTKDHRDEIDAACRQAVDTLEFSSQ